MKTIYIPIWLYLLYTEKKEIVHIIMIYIPIWLYLLLEEELSENWCWGDLHSNMVIFIIIVYRGIYSKKIDLHSNMVIFIIRPSIRAENSEIWIYIPIWLYLLCFSLHLVLHKLYYLHSNMVIFIIRNNQESDKVIIEFTFQYGYIYYPFFLSEICKTNIFYILI